jgi:hypothetical protein
VARKVVQVGYLAAHDEADAAAFDENIRRVYPTACLDRHRLAKPAQLD